MLFDTLVHLSSLSSLTHVARKSCQQQGVWEKDDIRKDDAFVTFEEVFELAEENKVDFVLLGGDLFHDNKPSRTTLVKTIDVLRRHCLNDRPVAFEILSNQAENFVNGRVNFDHPDFNVGLPVFTIHGNHDDPSGASNLSAVDVLSSCNLVNYFGKAALGGTGVGKITIKPILLQKGETRIALYGLGNIRDERLGRMFQMPGCIEWARPESDPDNPDLEWTSILVLHQNRYGHSQSARNYIKESYLPPFMDVVLWGHEHECIPTVVETAQNIKIIQPGSSVATALSEGESKKKHIVVLDILKESHRSVFHELQTVRPFKFDQVVLGEKIGLNNEDPEVLEELLLEKVESMIAECTRSRKGLSGKDWKRMPQALPLIRLRVDYTGFSTIHSQRFGQKFVGKVANPHDVLHWFKPKSKAKKAVEQEEVQAAVTLDENHIEDLIAENLEDSLAILPEVDLGNALHAYVDKDEKQALTACIASALQATQNAATQAPGTGDSDEAVAELLYKHAEDRRQAAKEAAANRAQERLLLPPPSTAQNENGEKGRKGRKAAAGSSDEEGANDIASDNDSKPLSKPAGGRGRRGRGRGSKQAAARGKGRGATQPKASQGRPAMSTQQSSMGAKGTPTRKKSTRAASASARKKLAKMEESEELSESDAEEELDMESIEDSENDSGESLEEERPAPNPRQKSQVTAKRGKGREKASAEKAKAAPAVPDSEPTAPMVIDSDSDEAQPPVTQRGKRRLPPALFGSSAGPSQATGNLLKRGRR